jgi:tRNA U34 5-methylaminomethyl-2-thiouridine-forming methyltransferase MnmC
VWGKREGGREGERGRGRKRKMGREVMLAPSGM